MMGKVGILFLLTALIGLSMGIVCPDQKSRCPSTSTCCQTSSGYGCCPYTQATCCSDELHCCPSHLSCDVAKSRCVPQKRIPFPFSDPIDSWSEIGQNTLLEVETEAKQQTCPDGQQKCPDRYTCCPLTGGGFGCCPENGGVCCADGIHCCPNNTTCNLAQGRCVPK